MLDFHPPPGADAIDEPVSPLCRIRAESVPLDEF